MAGAGPDVACGLMPTRGLAMGSAASGGQHGAQHREPAATSTVGGLSASLGGEQTCQATSKAGSPATSDSTLDK